MSKTLQNFLEEAREHVPEVTVADAKRQLDAGEFDLVLDVRETSEYDDGHIAGALLIPRGLLEFKADPSRADPRLHSDARIVVHCAAGIRSLLAAHTLKQMGFNNVTSMAGGFKAWEAEGLPVEKTVASWND